MRMLSNTAHRGESRTTPQHEKNSIWKVNSSNSTLTAVAVAVLLLSATCCSGAPRADLDDVVTCTSIARLANSSSIMCTSVMSSTKQTSLSSTIHWWSQARGLFTSKAIRGESVAQSDVLSLMAWPALELANGNSSNAGLIASMVADNVTYGSKGEPPLYDGAAATGTVFSGRMNSLSTFAYVGGELWLMDAEQATVSFSMRVGSNVRGVAMAQLEGVIWLDADGFMDVLGANPTAQLLSELEGSVPASSMSSFPVIFAVYVDSAKQLIAWASRDEGSSSYRIEEFYFGSDHDEMKLEGESSNPFDGAWHLITFTVQDASASRKYVELFVDGWTSKQNSYRRCVSSPFGKKTSLKPSKPLVTFLESTVTASNVTYVGLITTFGVVESGSSLSVYEAQIYNEIALSQRQVVGLGSTSMIDSIFVSAALSRALGVGLVVIGGFFFVLTIAHAVAEVAFFADETVLTTQNSADTAVLASGAATKLGNAAGNAEDIAAKAGQLSAQAAMKVSSLSATASLMSPVRLVQTIAPQLVAVWQNMSLYLRLWSWPESFRNFMAKLAVIFAFDLTLPELHITPSVTFFLQFSACVLLIWFMWTIVLKDRNTFEWNTIRFRASIEMSIMLCEDRLQSVKKDVPSPLWSNSSRLRRIAALFICSQGNRAVVGNVMRKELFDLTGVDAKDGSVEHLTTAVFLKMQESLRFRDPVEALIKLFSNKEDLNLGTGQVKQIASRLYALCGALEADGFETDSESDDDDEKGNDSPAEPRPSSSTSIRRENVFLAAIGIVNEFLASPMRVTSERILAGMLHQFTDFLKQCDDDIDKFYGANHTWTLNSKAPTIDVKSILDLREMRKSRFVDGATATEHRNWKRMLMIAPPGAATRLPDKIFIPRAKYQIYLRRCTIEDTDSNTGAPLPSGQTRLSFCTTQDTEHPLLFVPRDAPSEKACFEALWRCLNQFVKSSSLEYLSFSSIAARSLSAAAKHHETVVLKNIQITRVNGEVVLKVNCPGEMYKSSCLLSILLPDDEQGNLHKRSAAKTCREPSMSLVDDNDPTVADVQYYFVDIQAANAMYCPMHAIPVVRASEITYHRRYPDGSLPFRCCHSDSAAFKLCRRNAELSWAHHCARGSSQMRSHFADPEGTESGAAADWCTGATDDIEDGAELTLVDASGGVDKISKPPLAETVSQAPIVSCETDMLYTCRHECGYTVCQRCVEREPTSIPYIADQLTQEFYAAAKDNPFLFLLLFIAAQSLMYPLTQNCFMVIACHPTFQCDFPECYSDPSATFMAAVVLSVVVLVVFRCGIALLWTYEIFGRKRLLNGLLIAKHNEPASKSADTKGTHGSKRRQSTRSPKTNGANRLPATSEKASQSSSSDDDYDMSLSPEEVLEDLHGFLIGRKIADAGISLTKDGTSVYAFTEGMWEWFLSNDASILSSLYRKLEFPFMAIDPCLQLAVQVSLSVIAAFTVDDSPTQVISTAAVESTFCLFLSLTNFYADPWLDILAKLGSVHQILQMAWLSWYRADLFANPHTMTMTNFMFVTVALYIVVVILITYHTVVRPWLNAQKALSFASFTRREASACQEKDPDTRLNRLKSIHKEKQKYYGVAHYQSLVTRTILAWNSFHLRKSSVAEIDSIDRIGSELASYLKNLFHVVKFAEMDSSQANVGGGNSVVWSASLEDPYHFNGYLLRALSLQAFREVITLFYRLPASASRASVRRELEKVLTDIVESSRNDYRLSVAASNAMMLLAATRIHPTAKTLIPFVGNDFSGVSIPGAKLDGCAFINVNFRKANLNKVSFGRCFFDKVDFTGAALSNATFGVLDPHRKAAMTLRPFDCNVATGVMITENTAMIADTENIGLRKVNFADGTSPKYSDSLLTGHARQPLCVAVLRPTNDFAVSIDSFGKVIAWRGVEKEFAVTSCSVLVSELRDSTQKTKGARRWFKTQQIVINTSQKGKTFAVIGKVLKEALKELRDLVMLGHSTIMRSASGSTNTPAAAATKASKTTSALNATIALSPEGPEKSSIHVCACVALSLCYGDEPQSISKQPLNGGDPVPMVATMGESTITVFYFDCALARDQDRAALNQRKMSSHIFSPPDGDEEELLQTLVSRRNELWRTLFDFSLGDLMHAVNVVKHDVAIVPILARTRFDMGTVPQSRESFLFVSFLQGIRGDEELDHHETAAVVLVAFSLRTGAIASFEHEIAKVALPSTDHHALYATETSAGQLRVVVQFGHVLKIFHVELVEKRAVLTEVVSTTVGAARSETLAPQTMRPLIVASMHVAKDVAAFGFENGLLEVRDVCSNSLDVLFSHRSEGTGDKCAITSVNVYHAEGQEYFILCCYSNGVVERIAIPKKNVRSSPEADVFDDHSLIVKSMGLPRYRAVVHDIAFSPDMDTVAICSNSPCIALIRMSKIASRTLLGHCDAVTCLAFFNLDLVSISKDGQVLWWRAGAPKRVTVQSSDDLVMKAARKLRISPDGSLALVIGDGRCSCFAIHVTMKEKSAAVQSVVFVALWSRENLNFIPDCCHFAPDGRHVMLYYVVMEVPQHRVQWVDSLDGADPTTGGRAALLDFPLPYTKHVPFTTHLHFHATPDGKYLAAAAGGELLIRSIAGEERESIKTVSTDTYVQNLAMAPISSQCVFVSNFKGEPPSVHWLGQSGRAITSRALKNVTFAPYRGRLLGFNSRNNAVEGHDIDMVQLPLQFPADGITLNIQEEPAGPATRVRLNAAGLSVPDGRHLVTASTQRTIAVWEVTTSRLLHTVSFLEKTAKMGKSEHEIKGRSSLVLAGTNLKQGAGTLPVVIVLCTNGDVAFHSEVLEEVVYVDFSSSTFVACRSYAMKHRAVSAALVHIDHLNVFAAGGCDDGNVRMYLCGAEELIEITCITNASSCFVTGLCPWRFGFPDSPQCFTMCVTNSNGTADFIRCAMSVSDDMLMVQGIQVVDHYDASLPRICASQRGESVPLNLVAHPNGKYMLVQSTESARVFELVNDPNGIDNPMIWKAIGTSDKKTLSDQLFRQRAFGVPFDYLSYSDSDWASTDIHALCSSRNDGKVVVRTAIDDLAHILQTYPACKFATKKIFVAMVEGIVIVVDDKEVIFYSSESPRFAHLTKSEITSEGRRDEVEYFGQPEIPSVKGFDALQCCLRGCAQLSSSTNFLLYYPNPWNKRPDQPLKVHLSENVIRAKSEPCSPFSQTEVHILAADAKYHSSTAVKSLMAVLCYSPNANKLYITRYKVPDLKVHKKEVVIDLNELNERVNPEPDDPSKRLQFLIDSLALKARISYDGKQLALVVIPYKIDPSAPHGSDNRLFLHDDKCVVVYDLETGKLRFPVPIHVATVALRALQHKLWRDVGGYDAPKDVTTAIASSATTSSDLSQGTTLILDIGFSKDGSLVYLSLSTGGLYVIPMTPERRKIMFKDHLLENNQSEFLLGNDEYCVCDKESRIRRVLEAIHWPSHWRRDTETTKHRNERFHGHPVPLSWVALAGVTDFCTTYILPTFDYAVTAHGCTLQLHSFRGKDEFQLASTKDISRRASAMAVKMPSLIRRSLLPPSRVAVAVGDTGTGMLEVFAVHPLTGEFTLVYRSAVVSTSLLTTSLYTASSCYARDEGSDDVPPRTKTFTVRFETVDFQAIQGANNPASPETEVAPPKSQQQHLQQHIDEDACAVQSPRSNPMVATCSRHSLNSRNGRREGSRRVSVGQPRSFEGLAPQGEEPVELVASESEIDDSDDDEAFATDEVAKRVDETDSDAPSGQPKRRQPHSKHILLDDEHPPAVVVLSHEREEVEVFPYASVRELQYSPSNPNFFVKSHPRTLVRAVVHPGL